jgi:FkbM family methyltransferase
MQTNMLAQLQQVIKIASFSKLRRFLHNPFKYLKAIGYRKLIYPIHHKPISIKTNLFYNKPMFIELPAATDIYLTGGKSHISEIALTAFLIKTLKINDCFLDIGAHYGYYTLLAAELTGTSGNVMAYEPAQSSFQILQKNTTDYHNISACQQALSFGGDTITFYEFDNLKSEYNTTNKESFEQTEWIGEATYKTNTVTATSIDDIVKTTANKPTVIKIDVEGGEYDVIKSGKQFLTTHKPIVIMEYACVARNNEPHKKAVLLLQDLGYIPNIINLDGSYTQVKNIDDYITTQQIESDNIAFIKA